MRYPSMFLLALLCVGWGCSGGDRGFSDGLSPVDERGSRDTTGRDADMSRPQPDRPPPREEPDSGRRDPKDDGRQSDAAPGLNGLTPAQARAFFRDDLAEGCAVAARCRGYDLIDIYSIRPGSNDVLQYASEAHCVASRVSQTTFFSGHETLRLETALERAVAEGEVHIDADRARACLEARRTMSCNAQLSAVSCRSELIE